MDTDNLRLGYTVTSSSKDGQEEMRECGAWGGMSSSRDGKGRSYLLIYGRPPGMSLWCFVKE